MNKILFFCLLTMFCSGLFCAPSFLSITPLDSGKVMLQAGVDIFLSTNDLSSLFDGGIRVGLPIPKGSDFGFRLYSSGAIFDLKLPLFSFEPLSTAVDMECDIYQRTYILSSISPAFIVDVALSPYLSFYFSLRWRYPAVQEIDSTNPFPDLQTNVYVSGVVFYPRVGIELFRKWNFSIILEGGPVTSWYSRDLGINGGGVLEYKF